MLEYRLHCALIEGSDLSEWRARDNAEDHLNENMKAG